MKECRTCRHWLSRKEMFSACCSRYPPQVVSAMLVGHVHEDGEGGTSVSADDLLNATEYPETHASDVCGEWSTKEGETER